MKLHYSIIHKSNRITLFIILEPPTTSIKVVSIMRYEAGINQSSARTHIGTRTTPRSPRVGRRLTMHSLGQPIAIQDLGNQGLFQGGGLHAYEVRSSHIFIVSITESA